MNIILFDDSNRQGLYPLTQTCAVAGLRLGIVTIKERWEAITKRNVFVHTAQYLQQLYTPLPTGKSLWVNAAVLADKTLFAAILAMEENIAFADEYGFVAGILDVNWSAFNAANALASFKQVQHMRDLRRLQYPWQIFQWNEQFIKEDFGLLTQHRKSQPLPPTNQYINGKDIFIEEGAEVNFSILNASQGPIYVGKNAVIMEGSLIRGPFAICDGATAKMGTKIYAATTVGPHCLVGGEIKNAVLQGYSNKGHDGYLGDSVIGRWCNLGAGTSNSNVKNTGGNVTMWSYPKQTYVPVGQKAGVIMGDYTRTAINTSLNTGTVTGVCSNIFGHGLQPKHIRSFSWGGHDAEKYKLEKALADIANWKKMKHETLTDAEKEVLTHIFAAEG